MSDENTSSDSSSVAQATGSRNDSRIVLWPDDPAVRMEFVPIPPGEFWMGSRGENPSAQPRHRVIIPRLHEALPAFWLGRTPVTQAQFGLWTEGDQEAYAKWFEGKKETFRSDSDRVPHRNRFGPDDHLPAESLTWYEAIGFCDWLQEAVGQQLEIERPVGLPEDWRVHPVLPSEAQWEYACRAGSETDYANGDGVGALQRMGWFEDNSERKTHRVGLKDANGYGLVDMHGNVWEWCQDDWNPGAYRCRLDGEQASTEVVGSSPGRVLRGGSWYFSAGWCRSAYRYWWYAGNRFGFLGFRVCLLPGPVVSATQHGASQSGRAKAQRSARERGGTPSGNAPAAGADGSPNPLLDGHLPPPPH